MGANESGMVQEEGTWWWAEDANIDWLPVKVNQANFMTGFGGYFVFATLGAWEWLAWIIMMVLTTVNQILHAMIPDTSGAGVYVGGKGFNYSQLAYGLGGGLLGFLFDLMIPPHVRPMSSDPCKDFEEESDEWYDCMAENEMDTADDM